MAFLLCFPLPIVFLFFFILLRVSSGKIFIKVREEMGEELGKKLTGREFIIKNRDKIRVREKFN